MRVLAIDPGYGRCGVAVVEKGKDGKEILLYSDCIETGAQEPFVERLANVGIEIGRLITEYTPDHIALEELFFSTNQKTALRTAEVRGMILYVAHTNDIPVFEYNPGRIKIALTGDGRAGKDAVARMVARLVPLSDKKTRDDEIDAIAIALTHTAEGSGKLSTPKTPRSLA